MVTPKLVKARLAMAKKSGVLVLNFQGLEELPEAFRALDGVRELRLRGNKLRALPEWVCGWSSLEELDLGDNPIAELPAGLDGLPRLKQLLIEGTAIRELPSERLAKLAQASQVALDAAREGTAAAEAALAAKPAPKSAKRPRVRAPWKRLAVVASQNASLALLLVDADAAGEWQGTESVVAHARMASELERSRAVAVEVGSAAGWVVDSGAGQGIADLAIVDGAVVVVEPGWETTVEHLCEGASDADATANAERAASLLEKAARGSSKPIGELLVASGRLAVAWAWGDLRQGAAALRRAKPGRGAAKELEDAAVVAVPRGRFLVERAEVAIPGLAGPACVVRVRPERD